jgi:hypothetical protein
MSTESQIADNTTVRNQLILPATLNLMGLSDTAKNFATEISILAKASTESTVAMCEVYYRAKNALKDDEFHALCSTVGHKSDSSTIKKYILIGEKASLFRPYLDRLPNTWTTLYEITRLDADEFQQFITNGQINRNTTGEKIKSLVKKASGAAAKSSPPSRNITLKLGDGMTSDDVVALISHLEGLRLSYEFQIEPNSTTSRSM